MDGMLLFLFASLLALAQDGLAEYKMYYVERDCPHGNLTLQLDLEGAGSAVMLGATEHTSYSFAMDCRIYLSVPNDEYGIVVAIREIGFRSYLVGCQDYLEINSNVFCTYLYRPMEGHHFFSSGSTMELLYHVEQREMNNRTFSGHPGFTVSVTALRKGVRCGDLEGDWFQCDNGYCVWSELHCDTHNNCGDISDERECGADVEGGNKYMVLIILAILILLLLIIMCVATLLCSKNETIRRLSMRLRSRTISYMPRFSK